MSRCNLPTFFGQFLSVRGLPTCAASSSRRRCTARTPCGRWSASTRRRSGLCNLLELGRRTVRAKLRDRLRLSGAAGQFCSIHAAAAAHGVLCEHVASVNARRFL